nr:glycosyltransferase family 4 protein [Algoriphagus sp. AK58]
MNLWIYNQLLTQISLGFTVKPEQGKANLKLLPNLPFQLLQQGPVAFIPATDPRILFVGKLTYPPNLSGIKWFIREVFPLVLEDFPQAMLTLVSNLPVDDQELKEVVKKYTSIQVLINVKDLVEVYRTHSMAIAPIFEGAGSNIKIAESIWMGRPIVSSSFGIRGFEMAKGSSFLLEGSTAEEFKSKVVDLLKHQEKLVEVQASAFQFGQKEFNLTRWTAQFLDDLEHVG